MRISAPFHSEENAGAHRDAVAAAQGNQAEIWAVAPNHESNDWVIATRSGGTPP